MKDKCKMKRLSLELGCPPEQLTELIKYHGITDGVAKGN